MRFARATIPSAPFLPPSFSFAQTNCSFPFQVAPHPFSCPRLCTSILHLLQLRTTKHHKKYFVPRPLHSSSTLFSTHHQPLPGHTLTVSTAPPYFPVSAEASNFPHHSGLPLPSLVFQARPSRHGDFGRQSSPSQ